MDLILASEAKENADNINREKQTLEFVMNAIAEAIKEKSDQGKYRCSFHIEEPVTEFIDVYDILKCLTTNGYTCDYCSSIFTRDVTIDISWKEAKQQ